MTIFDADAILGVFGAVTDEKAPNTRELSAEKALENQQGNKGNRMVMASKTEKILVNQQGNKGNLGNLYFKHPKAPTHREHDTQRGISIINQLAAGLPITNDELMAFYADDFQHIGSGEITADTVKYSLMKLVEGRPPIEVDRNKTEHKRQKHPPALRWCRTTQRFRWCFKLS